jgi:hypothetical protein
MLVRFPKRKSKYEQASADFGKTSIGSVQEAAVLNTLKFGIMAAFGNEKRETIRVKGLSNLVDKRGSRVAPCELLEFSTRVKDVQPR